MNVEDLVAVLGDLNRLRNIYSLGEDVDLWDAAVHLAPRAKLRSAERRERISVALYERRGDADPADHAEQVRPSGLHDELGGQVGAVERAREVLHQRPVRLVLSGRRGDVDDLGAQHVEAATGKRLPGGERDVGPHLDVARRQPREELEKVRTVPEQSTWGCNSINPNDMDGL